MDQQLICGPATVADYEKRESWNAAELGFRPEVLQSGERVEGI